MKNVRQPSRTNKGGGGSLVASLGATAREARATFEAAHATRQSLGTSSDLAVRARMLASTLLDHADELDSVTTRPGRRQAASECVKHLLDAHGEIRRGVAHFSKLAGRPETHLRDAFIQAIVLRRSEPNRVARKSILALEVIAECAKREPWRQGKLVAAKAAIERAIAVPDNKGGAPKKAAGNRKTQPKGTGEWRDHDPSTRPPAFSLLLQEAGKLAGYLMTADAKDVLNVAQRSKRAKK